MNEISKQRMELARQNAGELMDDPNVIAMLVTGSVAKGIADDNSDIDTIVLYEKPLDQNDFDRIKEDAVSSGGGLYGEDINSGITVYKFVDGIRYDYGHTFIEPWEKELNEYLSEPDINNAEFQIMLSGFVDGAPIKGDEWAEEKRRHFIESYPDKYAEDLVKKNLAFHPKWVLVKMGLERNDTLFLYETFLDIEKRIFGILCGINRLYHPGKFKSADFTIDKMKIKPENLYKRFTDVFHSGEEEAIEILSGLIMETLDIVDKYMPGISTKRNREIFSMVLRR
ncbi:MAG: nucleotidyltransferase domain-containing protein [Ignavibacteriae bacterium]|nr:nucleotidyltransferase domain-containing protein [Ignavibacteriota bacterium]MCB9242250.1 nucleotidyltransferase domain-containing protein [Ignavibacteriales bacterium]